MASFRALRGKPGKFFDNATGKVVFVGETREDDMFDTVEQTLGAITAGQTRNFFRDLTNKERLDCNFNTARRLSAGEQMVLERIGVEIPQSHSTALVGVQDIKRVAGAGHLKFKINRVDISEGPLTKFPSGYGLSGQSNENNDGIANIGVPSTAAAAKFVEEQFITDEHDLDAVLTFHSRTWLTVTTMPTLVVAVVVRLYLHGLIKAPATNN